MKRRGDVQLDLILCGVSIVWPGSRCKRLAITSPAFERILQSPHIAHHFPLYADAISAFHFTPAKHRLNLDPNIRQKIYLFLAYSDWYLIAIVRPKLTNGGGYLIVSSCKNRLVNKSMIVCIDWRMEEGSVSSDYAFLPSNYKYHIKPIYIKEIK